MPVGAQGSLPLAAADSDGREAAGLQSLQLEREPEREAWSGWPADASTSCGELPKSSLCGAADAAAAGLERTRGRTRSATREFIERSGLSAQASYGHVPSE